METNGAFFDGMESNRTWWNFVERSGMLWDGVKCGLKRSKRLLLNCLLANAAFFGEMWCNRTLWNVAEWSGML